MPRSYRLLALAACVFAALAVGTMLAERLTQASAVRAVGERQDEVVQSAWTRGAGLLRAAAHEAQREAERIASDPAVAAALEASGTGALSARLDRLGVGDDAYVSAEVYAPDGTLLAWRGRPFDAERAREAAAQPALPATQLVRADPLRDALVAWADVPGANGAVGRVRVVRRVRVETPVRNAYLRSWRLLDDLARRTQTRLVAGPPDAEQGEPVPFEEHVLARLAAEPPAPQTLLRMRSRTFGHVAALWVLLVGACGLGATVVRARRERTARAGLVVALALVGFRLLLLWLDAPARWQAGRASTTPLAPLFDPTHFATTFGGGLLRSSGDLMLTALTLLAAGLTLGWSLRAGGRLRLRAAVAQAAAGAGALLVVGACGWVLARASERVVLDATLDLFARAPLVPPALHLFVFAAILTLALGLLLVAGAALRWAAPGRPWRYGLLALAVAAPPLAELSVGGGAAAVLLPFGGAAVLIALGPPARALLRLRSVLIGVLGLVVVVYPLLAHAYTSDQVGRMEATAQGIAQPRDTRALFAVAQALDAAASDADLARALALPSARIALARAPSARLDPEASQLARTTLLGTLGAYDVAVVLVDADGRPAGRFAPTAAAGERASGERLALLRALHAARLAGSDGAGSTVDALTGDADPERLVYAGYRTLRGGGAVAVWAEPQRRKARSGTPFPRALLPSQSVEETPDRASVALFRDGTLAREQGADFGRYRLDADLARVLAASPVVERVETLGGERFRVRYVRTPPPLELAPQQPLVASETVVAVRVPLLGAFDHLFFGLRVVLAGLLVALPLWGLLRWRAGRQRTRRFQERVLDAFTLVGGLSVVAVGALGLRVLAAESARAVQDDLRADLERVDELLAEAARPGELPYQVLQRTSVDSLARSLGSDLNVYVGSDLAASSRPELVRDALIPARMPAQVYDALVRGGARFATAEASIGTFDYTAGFRALADATGQARVVVSVPTLPAQERIAEEQARRVAYLLGSGLLLFVVVLLTASVLARALAGPIERLRVALERTARGQYQAPLDVPSEDEIGQLVRTFNDMQEQLAESRRQLAQQERQLAWREMARQVAHEIKNPLTPMKLSVQHLRRAFDAAGEAGSLRGGKFERLFERVTATLIEQTDALARIAGDFSTFARLPTRVPEPLDVSVVLGEAVRLMEQEQSQAEITTELAPHPLVAHADREELRRVFINLVKNGLQAMEDRPERRLHARTFADDGWAVARVSDTGAGIPDELRGRIFEPNFSTKTSGSGLGLAISREAVEAAGGAIAFETEAGVGTTFEVRLPLTESADGSEAVEDRQLRGYERL